MDKAWASWRNVSTRWASQGSARPTVDCSEDAQVGDEGLFFVGGEV